MRRETVRQHIQGPFLRQRLRSQSILLDAFDVDSYPDASSLEARLITQTSQNRQQAISALAFAPLPVIEEDEEDLDLINILPEHNNAEPIEEDSMEPDEDEDREDSQGELPDETGVAADCDQRTGELDRSGFYPLEFFDDTPMEVYKAQAHKPTLDKIKSCAIINFIARMEGGGSERLLSEYTRNFNFLLGGMLPTDELSIPLHDSIIRQLAGYTRLEHIRFDCCSNNCCAYTGSYRNLEECPFCRESRFTGHDRKSKRTWDTTSLIKRFRTMFADPNTARELQRQNKESVEPIVADVWDAQYIKNLRSEGYFLSYRDLALGLAHDGIQLFKIGDFEVTPILVTVFNFERRHRYNSKHQIVIGIIPGPSQPRDLNSFMLPIVDELKLLEIGVSAWDAFRNEDFVLKAHLIMLQADSPAMNKVINFVGFQGYSFCSHCTQVGIHYDGAIRCPHMAPKDLAQSSTRPPMSHYDVLKPEMRTHGQWLTDAQHMSLVCFDSEAEREREVRVCQGIKGFTPFLILKTIRAPYSFALDAMHILLANIEPLMFECWAGSAFSKTKKKTKKDGSQKQEKVAFSDENDYHVSLPSWKEIARNQQKSSINMPSSVGPALKPITTHHTRYTAGMRLQWILQTPVLLRGHLSTVHYDSWCSLVKVIQEILQPYDQNRIANIRTSLALFVLEFEQHYYRRQARSLPYTTSMSLSN